MLLDTLLDTFPMHSIRIPRLIIEEVGRNLTPEEFKEFIEFVINLTTIDEDFVVPFELGVRYEFKGLKPSDAFIAAYVEWTGANALVTENRHFLNRHSNLPFKVLNAQDCLKLIKSSG
jgi:predicted nucleic acid-binding protein